jgi:homogentisate 1,2-dioxygenase
MIHYQRIGDLPRKHHITHYEDGKLLMEQCVTRMGFSDTYSIVYFRKPPTDVSRVDSLTLPGFCPIQPIADQALVRRHIPSQNMPAGGNFLTGRRTMLLNEDISMGVCKPTEPPVEFFTNGDGDDCWFAYEGEGFVETLYGPLPFRKHDYVIIPKGTPYRLHTDSPNATFLVFESTSRLDIPKQFRNHTGQLTMDAPYCHRDFRFPTELLTYDAKLHGTGPWPHIIKRNNALSVHTFEHFPWDLAGWDGYVYPVAFNIHDYQPRTGMVHLPPTIHITFAGRGFVLCSFVPRVVDYYDRDGLKAIPCPYGHASVECDEILYYVEGNFTSRKGIGPQSISFHPMGVPHGPHPGTYEASIGHPRTSELAVMCDTYKPLRLTKVATQYEDANYHFSWFRGEDPGVSTGK